MPGCHCRSMPYSARRRAHLCNLEKRSRLLNSHVSAEQSVMRVNLLPHTYGLKWFITHNTAISFRSIGDRLASVRDDR